VKGRDARACAEAHAKGRPAGFPCHRSAHLTLTHETVSAKVGSIAAELWNSGADATGLEAASFQ
jgi:hypothetical protein